MNKILNNDEAALYIDKSLISEFSSLKEMPGVNWNNSKVYEYFSTGCSISWLNQILYFNEQDSDIKEAVYNIIEYYRKRNIEAEWRISLNSKKRVQQDKILSFENFEKVATPIMLLNLEAYKDNEIVTDLEIFPLKVDKIKEWMNPFSKCFGLNEGDKIFFSKYWEKIVLDENGFNSFFGIVNNEVVSCGSISLNGDIPIIYNIGTLSSHQRKGYGTQMTMHCIKQAINNKSLQVALFSTPDGLKTYKNLGFKEIQTVDSYIIK